LIRDQVLINVGAYNLKSVFTVKL